MDTHVQEELEANAPNGIVKATGADFTTYVNDASSTKIHDQVVRPEREKDDWEIAAKTFPVGELRNELIKSGKYDQEMCKIIKKMPKGNHKDEIDCVLNLLVPYWKVEKYPNAPPPSKQTEPASKENWEKFVKDNNMKDNRDKLTTMFSSGNPHDVVKCEEIKKAKSREDISRFITENKLEVNFN